MTTRERELNVSMGPEESIPEEIAQQSQISPDKEPKPTKITVEADQRILNQLRGEYAKTLRKTTVDSSGRIQAFPNDQDRLALIRMFFEAIGETETIDRLNQAKKAKPMSSGEIRSSWPRIRT